MAYNANETRTYSRLWEGYATDEDAKAARDSMYHELRREGHKVKRTMLRNQLKKYDGFGKPNGGICNVYYLEIIA